MRALHVICGLSKLAFYVLEPNFYGLQTGKHLATTPEVSQKVPLFLFKAPRLKKFDVALMFPNYRMTTVGDLKWWYIHVISNQTQVIDKTVFLRTKKLPYVFCKLVMIVLNCLIKRC